MTTSIRYILVLLLATSLVNFGTARAEDGGDHKSNGFYTGQVTQVDGAAATITFTNKNKEAHTVMVSPGTKILVNGQDGTLAAIQPGMYGGVKMAEDGKTTLELRAESPGRGAGKGKWFTGKITNVDAATSSVTFTARNGEAHTVIISPDTKIQVERKPAKLGDVQAGMYGGVKLAEDGKTTLELRAQSAAKTEPEAGRPESKHGYTGKITALDAAASAITFTNKNHESHTVTVTGETKIRVNGQPGTIDQVQLGMYGGARVADDGKTALELMAQSAAKTEPGGGRPESKHGYTGKVTAIDGAAVTFTNKNNEAHTVTVTPETKIRINGQPGTMDQVQIGMYGGARVADDGKTALELRAEVPREQRK